MKNIRQSIPSDEDLLPKRMSSVLHSRFVTCRRHLLIGSRDCDNTFDRIEGEHRDSAIMSFNRGPSRFWHAEKENSEFSSNITTPIKALAHIDFVSHPYFKPYILAWGTAKPWPSNDRNQISNVCNIFRYISRPMGSIPNLVTTVSVWKSALKRDGVFWLFGVFVIWCVEMPWAPIIG